ncbi:MAG: flavodoxin [Chloroflexi bacterium]|nr:MAG: flavodoxin [Chloroflexota bacterium]
MKDQERKESTFDFGSQRAGNFKILIAFASQYGSTGEVAEVVAEVLSQYGYAVDTKWIKDVTAVDHYDAVIVGSAIQYDKWMPEAVDFVKTHQKAFSKIPVAYFFTCLTLAKRNVKTEQQALAYADKLIALTTQVKPISIGRFAGVLDASKMSFLTRLMLKTITTVVGVREGDYRDWDAIRSWAKSIDAKLSNEHAEMLEAG